MNKEEARQMSLLVKMFPNFSSLKPTTIDWASDFQWNDEAGLQLAHVLLEDGIAAQKLEQKVFFERGRILRDDLSAIAAATGDEEILVIIDAIKLAASQPFTHGLCKVGELAQAYDWILWSISRNHVIADGRNESDYFLPPFDSASDVINDFANNFLVDWITNAYYVAVKFGGLDELCQKYFYYCLEAAVAAADGSDKIAGIEAAISLINWASHVDHSDLASLITMVEGWMDMTSISAQQRIRMATLLIGPGSKYSKKNPVGIARDFLQFYPVEFRDHERLQFLVVAIDSEAAWVERKEEIVEEIRNFRSYVEQTQGNAIRSNIVMEERVTLLYPLLLLLSQVPDLDAIIQLLSSWYGKPYDHKMAPQTLLVMPNNKDGAAWLWSGNTWSPDDQNVSSSLEQMLGVASEAFNDYFRGPAGDRAPVIDARLRGAPAPQHGSALEQQVLQHYRIAEVYKVIPEDADIKYLIGFPNHNVPLSSLVGRDLRGGLYQSVSLSSQFIEPKIQNVLIWPGETQTTDVEIDFIVEIGRVAGVDVQVWDSVATKDDFRNYYSSSNQNLLWITGHGNHDPGNVMNCGLLLGDGQTFNLDDFSELLAAPQQRAVVANICSGGAARMTGGIGSTGIASAITSDTQVTVAHNWPIDTYAALAFGTVFFSCLMDGQLAKSLHQAQGILEYQDQILAHLRRYDGSHRVIELLSSDHAKPRLENMMSWGSATLYS
jgi:hypothetical protein